MVARSELISPRGVGTQHQTSGQNIATAGEAFGERAEYQIGVGQPVDIDPRSNGVVGDHGDALPVGKPGDRWQINAAQ